MLSSEQRAPHLRRQGKSYGISPFRFRSRHRNAPAKRQGPASRLAKVKNEDTILCEPGGIQEHPEKAEGPEGIGGHGPNGKAMAPEARKIKVPL